MIEDTTFIVDLLRGDDRTLERLEYIEPNDNLRGSRPSRFSSSTGGVALVDRPEDERSRVLDILDSKHVVPADHDVMRDAGAIFGELYAESQPIDREGCVVAATALREEEPIVTRNKGHFQRFSGVEVVTY